MTQAELFSGNGRTIRRTSVEAYHKIRTQELLSPVRFKIYGWLFQNGPATANEIFQGVFGEQRKTNANVCARLNEMREMGVVSEIGERICRVTKQNVILWDVTDRLPKKLEKKPKRTIAEVHREVWENGYNAGKNAGYQAGYEAGRKAAQSQ